MVLHIIVESKAKNRIHTKLHMSALPNVTSVNALNEYLLQAVRPRGRSFSCLKARCISEFETNNLVGGGVGD